MLVIMFLKAASRRWSVPAAQHSNSGTGTPHVQTRVKMGLVESQGSITARCHGGRTQLSVLWPQFSPRNGSGKCSDSTYTVIVKTKHNWIWITLSGSVGWEGWKNTLIHIYTGIVKTKHNSWTNHNYWIWITLSGRSLDDEIHSQ